MTAYTNSDLVDVVRQKAKGYLTSNELSEEVLDGVDKSNRIEFITYRKVYIASIDWDIVDSIVNHMKNVPETINQHEPLRELYTWVSKFINEVYHGSGPTVTGEAIVFDVDLLRGFLSDYYNEAKELIMINEPHFNDLSILMMNLYSSATFYNENVRNLAYMDEALPIGEGQTCSQPSMVGFMADELKVEPGMRVLEIGTGCGYSAAVMGHMLGKEGLLFTVERIPILVRTARKHVLRQSKKSDYLNIHVLQADGKYGYPDKGPYDRIYLTAAVQAGFDTSIYKNQMKPDGLLLYPTATELLILENQHGIVEKYEGVRFVPLV